MESVIKILVGLKLICLVGFFAMLALALVYTTFTEPPPLPHEETWVCRDGDVQPPSLDREGCLHHGGLDHVEDGRR
ncbi:hypothetical protein [Streptomyces sp. NPDC127084]|uniref:hypothetical protein n=1 Tax=Streptomyces sp. NPDC127084 TaxID=3347133 RepID=UPI00364B3F30